MPVDLAVVILTFNEERHIGRALASIEGIASEIFVIDSFSTDRTAEIAEAAGAVVLRNPFVNQARQFEWGLANAPIASKWILRLDADEIIEPDLAAEIATELPRLGEEVAGVNLKRKHIFMQRWIRHGGRYPLIMLRMWRRGQGRIEQRWMDEHVIVWGGSVVTFKGGFSDHNLNNLTVFIDKHNKYATREALEVLNQKYNLFRSDDALTSTSSQAAFKRIVKEIFYNKLPFWAGPFIYFFFRYVILLGFLDGREGLIYHFLQGAWYRFLVGSKVVELEAALKIHKTNSERLRQLTLCTGLALVDEEIKSK